MFVSQERGTARKPFQKPNILRRKPKATKRSIEKNNECTTLSSNNDFGLASLPVVQAKESHSQHLQISQEPSFRVIDISEVCKDQEIASHTLNINGDSLTIYAHDAQINDNDSYNAQNTLNVESFLNHGSIKKTKMLFNIDNSSENVETDTKQTMCLDFSSEDSKGIITTSYYGSQISNIYIDKTSIVCNLENEPLIDTSLSENITLDVEESIENNLDSINSAVKYTCDVPNCKKSFWTEVHLQNHKNVHNKPKTFPVLQCPVKNTDAEGVETQCHRTFQIRNQLMKHLNEDHTPEDALYQCTKCGRRFYWACGARLHQAKGCARTYTCAWAGCGRVFRQQCRLREHARAHTGDRPYPCHYPGCGWSFRSASKLRRHARRHTGERRHACACGRAFPRGEHLREHAARCREPAPDLRATPTGCERTSSDTSSLYSHVKKAHKDEDVPQPTKRQKKKKDTFVVQLSTPPPQAEEIQASIQIEHIIEETSGSAGGVVEEVESCAAKDRGAEGESDLEGGPEEGQCARTHCTWPLPPREARYDLEEHTQVEQSESCESNIFSVRSDLFLHGNLLINEDSEFIISRTAAGDEGAAGLIDSHPTRDLTQEELMYADAVEESSFRVLLLNGEELA